MSLLSDIQAILSPLNIPIETGVFTDKAPDTYMVVVPLFDEYSLFCDNKPQIDIEEARISLYIKSNYKWAKKQIERLLISNDITITARQYIGYETDTQYHHYSFDVSQYYEMEDN